MYPDETNLNPLVATRQQRVRDVEPALVVLLEEVLLPDGTELGLVAWGLGLETSLLYKDLKASKRP